MSRLETFERDIRAYEKNSGEGLTGSIRIGIVLRNMEDGPLKTHLLFHSERLRRWEDFREELVNIRRAQVTSGATVVPMDIGVLAKGGGNGKHKGKIHVQNANPNADKQCHVCRKKDHISSECWQRADKRPPQTKGKGVGKAPKGEKGSGKGKNGVIFLVVVAGKAGGPKG